MTKLEKELQERCERMSYMFGLFYAFFDGVSSLALEKGVTVSEANKINNCKRMLHDFIDEEFYKYKGYVEVADES